MPKDKKRRPGPRSELKMLSTQMGAAILAANAWTTYDVSAAIAQGVGGFQRLGRRIRVTRVHIKLRWLPYQAASTLAYGLAVFRDAGITSGGFAGTDLGQEPLVGLVTPMVPVVRGTPASLTKGTWVTGQEVNVDVDIPCNFVIEYDDAGSVQGHTIKFIMNSDVTLSAHNTYRAVYFTDE